LIITGDIETRGLDAREFILGCLYINSKKQEYFTRKEDMWNRIIELGIIEAKKKRVLTIYFHNCQFDFYGIANLEDKNIWYHSLKPFIATYRINEKIIIKFLDSLGIFKMNLKELGDIIGKPKLETPDKFIKGLREQKIIEEDKMYIKRDSEIVYNAIYMLKGLLKEKGIKIRGLYTTSQIAINWFMNKLREDKENDKLFMDKNKRILWKTKYSNQIHETYRGGRVDCFKTGKFKNASYIDANNLYGYASMNIPFPDLRTEHFEYNPLRNKNLGEILGKIGICKVLIKNENNKLGLLPIRTDTGNYYPRKGCYLIGIWTTLELKEAVKEGYIIKSMEWGIFWEKRENPYKKITKELYELRLNSKNSFEKTFYKDMMNYSYGKLAQNRETWEMIIESVELAEEYMKRNWKAIKGIGKENYLYVRKNKEKERNYYCPIIPTLINAFARIYMYQQMKEFKYEDLLYHDTDSIMFQGSIPQKVKISNQIGEFKEVNKNNQAIIYGRKTYAIGDEIKIAGFKKRDININIFEKGEVTNMRMETLKTTKDLKKVGGFREEKRDLKEDNKKYIRVRGILDKGKVFKDSTLKNINYFIEELKGV